MPLLCIGGQTATGKTEAAMAVADRFDCVLVSADAMQVYRRFDIGTAKPSAEEQAAYPHRGIDIRDWDQDYNAAEFAADVAAVNEHVRRAIAVSFRLKDLRLLPVVLGLVTVIAWAAGVPGAYAFVIGFGTMAVLHTVAECWHCGCKFQQAVEEAVQRLLPKYEKIGVTIRREEVSVGDDGPAYYYLIFEVMQTDVEAPPDATSAGEVVVAGEIVRS